MWRCSLVVLRRSSSLRPIHPKALSRAAFTQKIHPSSTPGESMEEAAVSPLSSWEPSRMNEMFPSAGVNRKGSTSSHQEESAGRSTTSGGGNGRKTQWTFPLLPSPARPVVVEDMEMPITVPSSPSGAAQSTTTSVPGSTVSAATTTGKRLWMATRLARESKHVRRTQNVCVVGGEESIRRIWCHYRIRPNVVYVPNVKLEDDVVEHHGDGEGGTSQSIPSWCQSAMEELPTYVVCSPPVDIQRRLLSAEMSTPYAAEFPFASTKVLPLSSALKQQDDVVQDASDTQNGRAPAVRDITSMLVLVGLRIPSNVGTLIHAAEAMGFSCVTLVHCVDPFHEKVIRASRGSVFSPEVQLYEVSPDETEGRSLVSLLSTIAAQHHLLPLLAVPSQEEEPAFEMAKKFHMFNQRAKQSNSLDSSSSSSLGPMLILGGESHGLRLLADGSAWSVPYKSCTLPLPNSSVQSFNVGVAGCILMDLFRPSAEPHFAEPWAGKTVSSGDNSSWLTE